jgi:hypothetical protein
MSVSDKYFTELSCGTAYSFADWPNPAVSVFGAGVYTVWHNDGRFIYVGMSGRGMTAETIRRNTPQGIYRSNLKVRPAQFLRRFLPPPERVEDVEGIHKFSK